MTSVDAIRNELLGMRDDKYRAFHSKLMPTVDFERVIGIRTPQLRKYAVSLSKTQQADAFLKHLPHYYYEENNLHAFLLERIKDYDVLVSALDEFLPYVDNWATCDMMSPKAFTQNKRGLAEKIREWLCSEDVYAVRFAVVTLMKLYLDEDFDEKYMLWVSQVNSTEYYIKMAVAWYFATALAKQYDAAIKYLTQRRLDNWTHNKTIRKAIESNRISDSCKQYLRTLQI